MGRTRKSDRIKPLALEEIDNRRKRRAYFGFVTILEDGSHQAPTPTGPQRLVADNVFSSPQYGDDFKGIIADIREYPLLDDEMMDEAIARFGSKDVRRRLGNIRQKPHYARSINFVAARAFTDTLEDGTPVVKLDPDATVAMDMNPELTDIKTALELPWMPSPPALVIGRYATALAAEQEREIINGFLFESPDVLTLGPLLD